MRAGVIYVLTAPSQMDTLPLPIIRYQALLSVTVTLNVTE